MERSHTTKAALEQELAQWQQRCAALEAELAAKDSAMREAQDTLERSAAYNKRVYQDSPVPIVIIDPAIGIVDCNTAAVRIYGFQSRDEVLVLLCHKRSRTFTVAQYWQCPKALASSTLN